MPEFRCAQGGLPPFFFAIAALLRRHSGAESHMQPVEGGYIQVPALRRTLAKQFARALSELRCQCFDSTAF